MYIAYLENGQIIYMGEKKPISYDEKASLAFINHNPPKADWFTFENNKLIPHYKTTEQKANEQAIVNNRKCIAELKGFLSKTDYQAIKFAEGEMAAEEYEPIRQQRIAWRTEINKLEAL